MHLTAVNMDRFRFSISAALLVFSASPASAELIHVYELNGSFADSLGGPDLVPNGGSLGPTEYTFGPNEGLALSNAIDPLTYSIEITFRITERLTGYIKLIDFANLSVDLGLYRGRTCYRLG